MAGSTVDSIQTHLYHSQETLSLHPLIISISRILLFAIQKQFQL